MSQQGTQPASTPLSQQQIKTAADLGYARLDGANLPTGLFKNALINGSFDTWQRGLSISIPAATSQYVADRWRVDTGVASTAGSSRQTLPSSDGISESAAFLRIGVAGGTAAGDYTILRQPIERVRRLAGKRVVIRGWARRSNGAGNLYLDIEQVFGTGGSATQVTPGASIPLTTVWAPFAVYFNVPSIAGKTIGTANDYLMMSLWLSAGSNFAGRTNGLGPQTVTVDFADVEFREVIPGYGDQISPFERIPVEEEYRRCQRYFQTGSFKGPIGGNSNSGSFNPSYVGGTITLPVGMRTTPSVAFTDSAGTANTVTTGSGNGNTLSAGGLTAANNSSLMFDALLNSNVQQNWFLFSYTANAEI